MDIAVTPRYVSVADSGDRASASWWSRPGDPELLVAAALTLSATAVALRLFQGADVLRALLLIGAVALLAVINLRTGTIPDRVTLPLTLVGVVTSPFGHDPSLPGSVAGVIAAGGIAYGVNSATRNGIGGGTVKMAAMVGAFLGWKLALLALVIGTMGGGLWAGAVLLIGKRRHPDSVPAAPWLAAGAVASLLWGERILRWYLRAG